MMKKPATIDEYIATQSEAVRPVLEKVREIIRTAAPDAVEKISWQMPSFWQGEYLVHFCAHKNHLGIHTGISEPNPFTDKLSAYKTSKGTIQFRYDKPIDYELIGDVVKWKVEKIMNK